MKKILLIVFLLCCVSGASAQQPEWIKFDYRCSIDEIQDCGDFILGIYSGGMFIYDKTTKTTEMYTPCNSGLIAPDIYNFAVDKEKNLWITYDGFPNANKLTRFKAGEWFEGNSDTFNLMKMGIMLDNNYLIVEADSSGNIWINNDDGEIYQYDGTKFYYMNDSIVSGNYPFLFDTEGNLWKFTSEALHKYSEQDHTVFEYPDYLKNNLIFDYTIDEKNNIWLVGGSRKKFSGYDSTGLIHFDGSKWEKFDTLNSEIPSNNIYNIAVDKNGKVWLNHTIHRKYIDFNNNLRIDHNGEFSVFDGSSFTQYNIEDYGLISEISAMSKDSEDGIWLGHLEGLAHFDGKEYVVNPTTDFPFGLTNRTFSHISIRFDREGMPYAADNFIEKIYRYKNGKWREFYSPGGIINFDIHNNLCIAYHLAGVSLRIISDAGTKRYHINDTVPTGEGIDWLLCRIDDQNRLWYSYHSLYTYVDWYGNEHTSEVYSGLVRYDIDKQELKKFKATEAYYDDREGDIWTVRYKSKKPILCKIIADTVHCYTNEVPGNDIQNFAFDSKNNVWFSCRGQNDGYDHLLKFDGEKITDYGGIFLDIFPDYQFNEIEIDSEDNLWLSTDKGIIKFDGENKTEVFTNQTNDFLCGKIYGLDIDKFDNIWIHTEYALVVYRKGGVLLSAEDEPRHSAKLMLSAHPNPFSQLLITNYELQMAGYVSLKVYDLLGNEVSTLVDGWQEAVRHEARFDAAGLPEGMYILKLQAGSELVTRKVVKF